MFIYEKGTQHGLKLRKLIGSYEVIYNLEDQNNIWHPFCGAGYN